MEILENVWLWIILCEVWWSYSLKDFNSTNDGSIRNGYLSNNRLTALKWLFVLFYFLEIKSLLLLYILYEILHNIDDEVAYKLQNT